MKKALSVLLSVLFICSVCCSCADSTQSGTSSQVSPEQSSTGSAGESAPTGEKVKVSIFHRWPETNGIDTHNKIWSIIAEKEPEIEIVNECVPNDMYEVQLSVRLASADAPDIFATWPGGRVEAFVANGTAKDITDLWEEQNWDEQFIEAVSSGCTHFDGKKYVVPMNIMPNTIFYNNHIFTDLGLEIPTTWEELMDVCEVIKQNGITPFVAGAQGARWGLGFWFDYLLLNTAGGEFRENLMQGKESWESEEVYRAFEAWKEMIDKGYFNQDIAAIDPNQIPCSYIAQGKCAMMLNGPWTINNLGNVDMIAGDDFGSFTFPQMDDAVAPASEGCIEAWGVNANTQNYEACKKLLAYWGTKEICDLFTSEQKVSNPRRDMTLDAFSEAERVIMEQLIPQYENKTLYNNYELATIPVMQEAGMNAFVEFVGAPDTYKTICANLQQTAEENFQ